MTSLTNNAFFAVAIQQHRFLGSVFTAHLLKPFNPDGSILTAVGTLTNESVNDFDYPFSNDQKAIIRTLSEYCDSQLLKLFGKSYKNLPAFIKGVEENQELKDYIRGYVERRMLKAFDTIVRSNTPIFLKEKNFNNIYQDQRLIPAKSAAEPIFNFELTDSELKYHLSATCGDDKINLTARGSEIICNDPCLLMVNHKLYRFTAIDGKKLSPFFAKPFIAIPKSAQTKYMETFVLNAIRNQRVEAIGFTIDYMKPDRQVILSIEERFAGGWAIFLKLGYGAKTFMYGEKPQPEVVLNITDGKYEFQKFQRDTYWEDQQAEALVELGLKHNGMAEFTPAQMEQTDLYSLIGWISKNREMLDQKGLVVRQQNGKTPFYLNTASVDIYGGQSEDWFDIHGTIKLQGFEIPFMQLKRNIIKGIREFTLPNGQIFVLPEDWFTKYKALFLFGKESGDKLLLPRSLFNLLIDSDVQAPTANELRKRFTSSKPEAISVPSGLKASLRDYQKEGLFWLNLLSTNKMGGCLADDMGLGKTLQTLAFLQQQKETRPELYDTDTSGPVKLGRTTLIVVPTSLVHNWLREIQRFTPNMYVHVFTGTQRTRSIAKLLQYDIVITTYGVVRNDIDMLKDARFNYVILDESQTIKNPTSKIYRSVLLLKANGYLTLSGTPIENSLMDLWAQLNFLNRGMLGSQRSFRDEFIIPIEKNGDERMEQTLKGLIEPFVLRRRKEEVAKDLPEVTEQIVYCEMTDSQQGVYDAERWSIRNSIIDTIAEQGFERSAISILRGLTRLRQIANHPAMLDEQPNMDSGKFEEITRSLESVVTEGHKILVFSSFVKHLNLVANHLDEVGIGYEMLTGSTVNRKEVVNRFQSSSKVQVFLISIKAGGVGLNLTAADYIFILDPWWNPAVENQAIARAHRIGQDKNIFVYRFITVDTVEEKIVRLQERKELLAKNFVESANPLRLLGERNVIDMLS